MKRCPFTGFSLTGLLLALSLFCSCSEKESRPAPAGATNDLAESNAPNVLLIICDTLRADHVGLYGCERDTTPNIDRWFSQGTVFERAYSASSNTPPSVLSILTGLIPQRHEVRMSYMKAEPDLATLPRLLGEAGYQTAGIVSNPQLTAEACALDSHFDYYDDYVSQRKLRNTFIRDAAGTSDAVLKWLTLERDESRPHLLWIHYMEPHGPYRPPESKPKDFSHSGKAAINPSRVPAYQIDPEVVDALEYVDRYDEEVAFLDSQINRVLEAYETVGLAGKTLMILTADHGETLVEPARAWSFNHNYHVYEELIHVPLVVRGPGFAPDRISKLVSTVDILPTVLNHLGLPVPEGLDGVPLSEPVAGRQVLAESIFNFNTKKPQWRCLVQDKRKWVVGVARTEEKTIQERLYYDLAGDPGEQAGLPSQPDEVPSALLAMIDGDTQLGRLSREDRDGERIRDPKIPPELPGDISEEALEVLRSIGYVEP